ncbi:MAG: triose-phosphate isomerase [Gammaproteobacteria bacterium]|nr:triose-phosphate isomerase [Gammaproteobacteria bacterium]
MRQPLVAGNWKMNGSKQSIEQLLTKLSDGASSVSKAEIAVCPPSIYLAQVESLLAGTAISWGGQDLCGRAASGAFTGEISADMLNDFACKYVIVGHSERRSLNGEDDALVADKLVTAHTAKLVPIFCVGESLEERESGTTEAVVGRQLDAILMREDGLNALTGSVVAYEPVWAIGTGKTATPEQAQEVHAFIRKRIAKHNPTTAAALQILYGGSVKAANAATLFSQEDIDGGLVGGASLDAEEFLNICRAADQHAQ